MAELCGDAAAEHAFHVATSQILEWPAAVLQLPSERAAPALQPAPWARRCCATAGLPWPGGEGGTLHASMGLVRQLAGLVSRMVVAHVQQQKLNREAAGVAADLEMEVA